MFALCLEAQPTKFSFLRINSDREEKSQLFSLTFQVIFLWKKSLLISSLNYCMKTVITIIKINYHFFSWSNKSYDKSFEKNCSWIEKFNGSIKRKFDAKN